MIKEIIERNREEVDEIKKIYNDFYESAKEDTEGRRLFKSWFPERKILGSVYILLKHSSGHKIILNRS